MSKQSTDDFIHRPQGDSGPNPDLEAAPPEQLGYAEGSTKDGKNITCDVEAKNCLAKQVKDPATGSIQHFIKMGTFGALNDWLYDPYDGNMREGDGGRHAQKGGRPLFAFKKVSSETFDFYLNFLRTRNKLWLNHARRSRS